MMSVSEEAERLIRSHILWSMGAGLVPVPLFDIAAVTAIQIGMIEELCQLHGTRFTVSSGKTFVSALTGSTFAKIGASLIKAIPGVGTLIGGLSMSVMSGASTYAVGQVVATQLSNEGSLDGFDPSEARGAYKDHFETGKSYVGDLKTSDEESKDVFTQLEKLGKLREQGVLTDEEFETQKAKLLDRL